MIHYETTEHGERTRVRWFYDEEYLSEGSFAYDTEEETARAVREEEEGLERGDLVALWAMVETRCDCCGSWSDRDSLHGIVVRDDEDLTALAVGLLVLDWEEVDGPAKRLHR